MATGSVVVVVVLSVVVVVGLVVVLFLCLLFTSGDVLRRLQGCSVLALPLNYNSGHELHCQEGC